MSGYMASAALRTACWCLHQCPAGRRFDIKGGAGCLSSAGIEEKINTDFTEAGIQRFDIRCISTSFFINFSA